MGMPPSWPGRAAIALVLGLALACGGATTATEPTITSFTPASGVAGSTVTVTGSGFSSGIDSATLGSVAIAPGTIASDTRLSFTVPAAAVTGAITLTTPGGTAESPTEFIVAPAITGLSPRTGSAQAGTPVTVTGSGLMGITQIRFGTALATATSQTANQIVVPVPAGAAAGAVDLTFTVDPGYDLANLLSSFTVTE